MKLEGEINAALEYCAHFIYDQYNLTFERLHNRKLYWLHILADQIHVETEGRSFQNDNKIHSIHR
jgi:hypothetical protein